MTVCKEWEEQLSAYADGELSEAEEQALQEHLRTCRGCREALTLLRVTAEAMREEQTAPPEKLAEGILFLAEKERQSRGFSLKKWRFTAIAAVICLGVLGVVHFSGVGSRMAAQSKSVSVKADAAVPPAGMDSGSALYGYMTTTTEHPVEAAPETAEDEEQDDKAEVYNGSLMGFMADSTNTSQPAPEPESAPQAAKGPEEPSPAETSQPVAAGGAASAGAGETGTDTFGTPETRSGDGPVNPVLDASALPGYQIYKGLENAEQYYSVCFVYGSVPETVSGNRDCLKLDAPEGQERWLIPLSVCLNEELRQQFNEVYYGDLLSQQGMVIAIEKEEEEWAP